jgi:hypothetical protein
VTEPAGPPAAPRRADHLTLAVFAATLATHAAATWKAGAFDDAFITYTFARNVAAGHGFVWFPGEAPLYGSSTVPYALLLAALQGLGASIPAASTSIGCLAWAGANALLFRCFLAPWGMGAALAAAALNALSLRAVSASLGMETGLYVLLVCAAFWAYGAGRLRLSGALAGLVVVTRLDGALVPMLLVAHALLAFPEGRLSRRRRAACVALPAFLVVVPWGVALQAYFGSVVPHTLLAKTQGMALAPAFSPLTVLRALAGPRAGDDLVLPATVLALGLLGIALGAHRWRAPQNLFFLWGGAYLALFTASRIPESPWYAAALLPVLHQGAVAATRALQVALRRVFMGGGTRLTYLVWLPAAAQLVAATIATGRAVRTDPLGRNSNVTAEHRLLAELVLEDMRSRGRAEASVLAFEVGYLGYLIPGRVHDVLGLVSPEVVERGPLDGPMHLLSRHQPDYAVLVDARLSPPLSPLVESRAFREQYALISSQPTSHGADYQVLRRQPDRWHTTWVSPPLRATANAGGALRLAVPDVAQDGGMVCLDADSRGAGPLLTTLDLGDGDEAATRFPFWIAAGVRAFCRPGGFSGQLHAINVSVPAGREPLTITGLSILAAREDFSPAGRFRACLESPTLSVAGPVSATLRPDHVSVAEGTVVANPPSGFVLRLRNDGRPVTVRFAPALAPHTPPARTDGVTFVLAAAGHTLFERHVVPGPAYPDVAVVVPGSEGHKEVDLAFTTTPGPNGDAGWDWAEWRHLALDLGDVSLRMPDACPVP